MSVPSPCHEKGCWGGGCGGLRASGRCAAPPLTPGELLLHDDLTSFYALLLLSIYLRMTHAYVSTFHFLYGSREERLNIVKTSWQLGSSPLSHLTLRQRRCQPLPRLFQAASPSSARPGVARGRNPHAENHRRSLKRVVDPSPGLRAKGFVSLKRAACPAWGGSNVRVFAAFFSQNLWGQR